MDRKEIDNRFSFHAATEQTGPMFDDVRARCLALAKQLNKSLPEGRSKSLALTSLEEVMFHANAAIARHDWSAPAAEPEPAVRRPRARKEAVADATEPTLPGTGPEEPAAEPKRRRPRKEAVAATSAGPLGEQPANTVEGQAPAAAARTRRPRRGVTPA